MTNPKIKIHNIETDEIIEREMNAEELAQLAIDQAEREATKENAIALEALKASAKAKLIAGEPLTADEADTLVI